MKSAPRYCFWSVNTIEYSREMQNCIDSARQHGVFNDFHILTHSPLESCHCYELLEFQFQEGLFPIFYLKLAMSRLNYDYFVWIDADTTFRSPPTNLLDPVRYSPIHAPLTEPTLATGKTNNNIHKLDYSQPERMKQHGLVNRPLSCHTAWWIIHHDAIATAYEIVQNYWFEHRLERFPPRFDEALGFAVQILCGNPRNHLNSAWPHLWNESPSKKAEPSKLQSEVNAASAIHHLAIGHRIRSRLKPGNLSG